MLRRHWLLGVGFMLCALPACTSGPLGDDAGAGGSGGAGGSTGTGGTAGAGLDDGGQLGLDNRPANPTCVAPATPPPTNAGVATQRAFPRLTFAAPLMLLQPPGEPGRVVVMERAGRIVAFPNDPDAGPSEVTPLLDITTRVNTTGEGGLLGLAFHPQWPARAELYVSYTTANDGGPFRSVISRFRLQGTGPRFEPASEEPLLVLNQPYTNHNGGNLAFGPDGYLYIGFGDGGSSNDPLNAGQRLDTTLGKFLRIDVNVPFNPDRYGIPQDNPFATGTACNRGSADYGTTPSNRRCAEIYAWGLRNPWRWSFDQGTGELWAGDVGQGAWEEVDKITRGGNYGWKVREGAHCFQGACDAGGLIDPVVEYGRTLGVSITGGFVYRGSTIPTLVGKFVYGDYQTGRIWAVGATPQGQPVAELLQDTNQNIGSFGQTLDGEVFVLGFSSGELFKLVPQGSAPPDTFPRTLSATGCFDPTDATRPLPALIPFDLNSPLWSDGATKERFFAIPDGSTITLSSDGDFQLPNGSVTVKTFFVGGRRVETRLFLRHGNGQWAGYSYEWNDAQTDATLLPAQKTKQVGGLSWYFPSRAQCLTCHTPSAGFTLGLELAQLDRELTYPTGRTRPQLATLAGLGFFAGALPTGLPRLVDPLGTMGSLEARARSYLHANCAGCHRSGAGQGPQDFRFSLPLSMTNLCNVAPLNGDLGVSGARLITPGAPSRSLVSLRMQALGAGRMPPLASAVVHSAGVAAVDAWIASLTACP